MNMQVEEIPKSEASFLIENTSVLKVIYISVLTISGKSRNIKINPPPHPPYYGIVSIFPEDHFIMTPPF